MKTRLPAAALGLLALAQAWPGAAAEPNADCGPTLTRARLVACSLGGSLALREAAASRRAAEGRDDAARPVLPSNPAVSGTLSSRSGPAEQRLNWSVGLSQEFEVAGQRGLRLDVTGSELRAQTQRLASIRASVLAEAWVAWFEALAASERLLLLSRLEAATQEVASTVTAMTAGGLSSELDADIAGAAALRASQQRLQAQEALAVAQTQLRLLVGGSATPVAAGELEPLREAGATTAERPELGTAQETQAALVGRVALLARSRAPNPTVSLFAQNDGFDERVLGVGLSVPIPVARTLSGELAEARALAERAEVETERVRRELQAELEVARAQYEMAAKARALYPTTGVARATGRLETIAAQVKAARLPVREDLVAQQALMEQLRASIDAREALCVASVRLARAAGLSLEGETP